MELRCSEPVLLNLHHLVLVALGLPVLRELLALQEQVQLGQPEVVVLVLVVFEAHLVLAQGSRLDLVFVGPYRSPY